ncbi:MAG: GIY-YIG nuclease family protein [Clostridia bacterium]|nr:GIY-YIG nuclease family protein [Clostridia bacterium]MBO7289625.1 GIY-YIG nuclease family protein [Clostridia bacterium]
MYYIYVLRCMDNSLYTGITTDVKRRFGEHTKRRSSSEKYTRARKVVSIEAVWSCISRSDASKLEYAFKKLTKAKKEEIILNPLLLKTYLENKIDADKYEYKQHLFIF